MRKIVEYTLISLDGVFENPQSWGFMNFDQELFQDRKGHLRTAV
jgi:hypothetical protein